ncbi:hypothetical protein GCM10027299_47810 [Larkinella ripae]
MLTLDTFDRQLDKNTVQKGRHFFTQRAVLYLEQASDTHWNAEVEGSEVYSVEIQLAGRTIADFFCDCPAEIPACPHTVAVLFALRETLNQSKANRKKSPQKLTVENLLQKVTTDELRQFVVAYAASDKTFASRLQLHFADKDERIDVGKHYTELVRKAIKTHSTRGFVESRSAARLAREMTQILAGGKQLLARQNYRDALTIARVVLVELMAVLQQSDDSAGHLGDAVSETLKVLHPLAESAETAQPLRDQLFDFLADQLQQPVYFGFGDFGRQLLDAAFELALKRHEPTTFLALIDRLLPLHQGSPSDYPQSLLRTTRIRFLKALGRTHEAAALIRASLDLVEVRREAVSEAIEALHYDRARALIEDGIRLAEQKNQPGTVRQWEEALLNVAYLEKDIPAIRHLTRTLAFEGPFSLPYYRQWKQTFSAKEWTLEYQSLIQRVTETAGQQARQSKAHWYFEADTVFHQLAPIYVEEKQWTALLALVDQSPSLDRLQQVHPHLASRFPAEMLTLYLPVVEQLGKNASERPQYRRLAQLIGQLKQDIPESVPVMNALIQQLKERNPRRPAFLEELRQVEQAY